MKVISIHRLMLQFDADQATHGSPEQQAREAVSQINALLQREPFGLGAQIFDTPDEIEVEAEEEPSEGAPKRISIHRIMLQFDADQITHGKKDQQADQAVDLINSVLQREPYGLAAQIYAERDEIEVEMAKKED
jgi:hypothetical protein